ncbi:hypothetical protein [Wenzhouxiangella sediminis]|uniref:Uncharacterized protein n=1 Tax=Wenzhouxiangella sediminis TaxID=1792836 RepID=A0A3E1KA52_9GAMM|nr:hypothetical protein [Wenzhouxiangella sediminis]RFF31170.1 hypothetical protein DZC52_04930 [Wenzhouxiangella sediminis]
MTGKDRHHDHRNHDGDQERLAQLYREQGDIEPGPGVDQRIRAKAHDEVRPSSLPRPAHWLGGAAVAASLFVVVSIVVNMEPPQAEFPMTEPERQGSPQPAAESDRTGDSGINAARSDRPFPERAAFRERPIPVRPESPPPSLDVLERRARATSADTAQGESERAASPSAGSPAAEEKAGEDEVRFNFSTGQDGPGASELLEEWSEAGPAPDDALEQTPLESAEPRLEEMQRRTADAERALWLIDQLIAVGNAERARAEMEDFRERYSGQEIPAATIERLEALEVDGSGD